MGPCLCGDYYCHSCGPAQGNHRCYQCGAWSADGGCKDPEDCERRNREQDAAEARDLAEADRLANEYWASVQQELEKKWSAE